MAKNIALIFGIVFVLVGLIGFIGGLGIVGPMGLFATDTLHDIVHFVGGLVLLYVALAAPSKSAITMVVLGVVYLVVTLLGFLGLLTGIILIGDSDNYLHLVLGIVLLVAGLMYKDRAMM